MTNGPTCTHTHNHKQGQEHEHTNSSHKHIHSAEEKKAVINRLAKASGHIEAIKRMVENDVDCSQILIQLAAVRAAINNTGNLVLKNHINHCIVEAVEEGDVQSIKELNEAIDKFMK